MSDGRQNVYKTNNGGLTWSIMYKSNGASFSGYNMAVTPNGKGYFVGNDEDSLFTTSDF